MTRSRGNRLTRLCVCLPALSQTEGPDVYAEPTPISSSPGLSTGNLPSSRAFVRCNRNVRPGGEYRLVATRVDGGGGTTSPAHLAGRATATQRIAKHSAQTSLVRILSFLGLTMAARLPGEREIFVGAAKRADSRKRAAKVHRALPMLRGVGPAGPERPTTFSRPPLAERAPLL